MPPRLKTLPPALKLLSAGSGISSSPTKRITGNSLNAIKRRFAVDHPRLCAECARKGLVGYGDELDHIVPLHLGGAESDGNRQWLCRMHHAEKSAAEAKARSFGVAIG